MKQDDGKNGEKDPAGNKKMSDLQRDYLRKQATKESQSGLCNPLYRDSIEQMMQQQRDDPMETGLVIINSFDYELEEIKEDMIDRRIYAEVFEIDRL